MSENESAGILQGNVAVDKKQFFLCYECGDNFSVKSKYEEHILLHQAILFCYQIYEYERAKALARREIERKKAAEKQGSNRRSGFEELPRKNSKLPSDVSAKKQTSTNPPSKAEKSLNSKNSAADRIKDSKGKNSLNKSSSMNSLQKPVIRKLGASHENPLLPDQKRKICNGGPSKRKKTETFENAEVPRKVVKLDELQKPRQERAEVTSEASILTSETLLIPHSPFALVRESNTDVLKPISTDTSIRRTTQEKPEENLKIGSGDDKSSDTSSSDIFATSPSVSSSSSSSLFLSPSTSNTSSSSSPSLDSAEPKKRSILKQKFSSKLKDDNSEKSNLNTTLNDDVRNPSREVIERSPAVQQSDILSKIPIAAVYEAKPLLKEHDRSDVNSKNIDLELIPNHNNEQLSDVKSMERAASLEKQKSTPTNEFPGKEEFTNNLTDSKEHSDSIPAKIGPTQQLPNNSCGQQCIACSYISAQGSEMIEHVTRYHSAVVVKLEKRDCINGVWTEFNEVEPNEKCTLCDRCFDKPTDYFIHIIICHKASLLAPNADRFTCAAHLAHPGLPPHTICIHLKRPQP